MCGLFLTKFPASRRTRCRNVSRPPQKRHSAYSMKDKNADWNAQVVPPIRSRASGQPFDASEQRSPSPISAWSGGALTILLFLIVCTTDALRSHSISGIAELNPVAGLSRGDDVTNRGRALLGFCDSTPRHDAHGPADDRRGVSLDFPRHLQPGDHRSPRSQECKQQSEFLRGPFDGLRCAACGARSGVNLRNGAVFALQKLVRSLGEVTGL